MASSYFVMPGLGVIEPLPGGISSIGENGNEQHA